MGNWNLWTELESNGHDRLALWYNGDYTDFDAEVVFNSYKNLYLPYVEEFYISRRAAITNRFWKSFRSEAFLKI